MMKFLNGAVTWWVAVFLIKKENRELPQCWLGHVSLDIWNHWRFLFSSFHVDACVVCLYVNVWMFAYVWTVVCVWICVCRSWGWCESSDCSSISFFKAAPLGATPNSQTLLAFTPSLLLDPHLNVWSRRYRQSSLSPGPYMASEAPSSQI